VVRSAETAPLRQAVDPVGDDLHLGGRQARIHGRPDHATSRHAQTREAGARNLRLANHDGGSDDPAAATDTAGATSATSATSTVSTASSTGTATGTATASPWPTARAARSGWAARPGADLVDDVAVRGIVRENDDLVVSSGGVRNGNAGARRGALAGDSSWRAE